MNSQQPALFHEHIHDALKEVVAVLGGPKKVGPMMRPDKPADAAARWLDDCLNSDRRERLDPDQVIWLLREARRVGCHAAINFIAGVTGYAPPQPMEPEDERAKLQRRFIESVQDQKKILARFEQMKDDR